MSYRAALASYLSPGCTCPGGYSCEGMICGQPGCPPDSMFMGYSVEGDDLCLCSPGYQPDVGGRGCQAEPPPGCPEGFTSALTPTGWQCFSCPSHTYLIRDPSDPDWWRCECDPGYVYSPSIDMCVAMGPGEQPPEEPPPKVVDPTGQCPAHSHPIDDPEYPCECDPGYVADASEMACVLAPAPQPQVEPPSGSGSGAGDRAGDTLDGRTLVLGAAGIAAAGILAYLVMR